jgi:hypothetical protein
MRRTYRRSQPRAGPSLWFASGSAITHGETSDHIGCPAGDRVPDGLTADCRLEATGPIGVSETQPFFAKRPRRPRSVTRRSCPANAARRRGFSGLAIGVAPRAYSRRTSGGKMPGMTAATTTPLQSKFGPIVADAAGTITVQEASDILDCSRFRVGELMNASAGRVLVTDVLALTSLVPPSALQAPPLPSSSAK